MMQLSRWKITLVTLVTLLGIWFSLPNLLPKTVLDQYAFLPKNGLNLGLDLQGGSHLLLEVDTEALARDKIKNLTEETRDRLRSAGIAFGSLTAQGDVVSVRINEAGRVDAAVTALTPLSNPLVNNPSARDVAITKEADQVIHLTYTKEGKAAASSGAVDASIETVRRRVDNLGTREPTIIRQGTNRIVVQAPGESDPEQLKRVIGTTAKLTFQMVDESASPADVAAGRVPPGSELLPTSDPTLPPSMVVKKRVIVSGENLTKAFVDTDQSNRPAIGFRFDGEGARKFGEATSQNIGRPFAIILDGKVVSAPRIISAITGGSGQITGNFTVQEASELVNVLNGGALTAPLNIEEQRVVSAELGADSVAKGQLSTIIAFISVLIFMLLAYGWLFGGISIAALIVNLILIIAGMSVTQATLTLPGIAGLILTLAVAVDANVLIYERMRDEIRAGRNVIGALDAGFSKAMETIIDANLTSLGAAAIMFFFGAGPVRGFAWTLSLGVITSVFSAVMVTQLLLAWWYNARRPKTLPIQAADGKGVWPLIKILPQKTNFGFVRFSKLAGIISMVLVAASLFFTIWPATPPCGGLNCGVDFKGGTILEMSQKSTIDLAKLRSTLDTLDLHDVQVQGAGQSGQDAMIRFESPTTNAQAALDRVQTSIKAQFPDASFKPATVVGPKVSGELFTGGILALVFAIGLMMVYIWFRFEWQFGMGAVVGLMHDVILTFGLFAIFRLEFTLTAVAAILTIIGYSMNDTVVVFDRIRENLRKYKKMPLKDVIDLSINETLSRTIITGVTAVMALTGLAVLGGEALFSFSVALIFGIIIGTYSSIYVAAPVILLWGVNRNAAEAEVVDVGGFKGKKAPQP
ncbi:protein translocase subunit SecD [Asticcacaulis excentricus]|uniref:Multifunctional fusion protein n=1 Tax=Asticcacaulis excentricus (strain ATCC 15261 / DSM 4724 / KCTC 12464 / NCIMB 9791 / VKM B-1370 / CB 48) TaxID=573065 RepID=E8RNL9_ASTEC|nr:protein translocase subunit SecD [Asticcacaulis excentricus]ADU12915.1 protein-export membrane protein SecD [Asticcacaulis excentricus CB 48]